MYLRRQIDFLLEKWILCPSNNDFLFDEFEHFSLKATPN